MVQEKKTLLVGSEIYSEKITSNYEYEMLTVNPFHSFGVNTVRYFDVLILIKYRFLRYY